MKFLTAVVFSLVCFISAEAQIIKSKLDFVGGLSYREYFHIGARYQYSEITQLGVYFGNDLELKTGEAIKTFCVDNMIHFGKQSYYSNRPVWYARQGYTFLKNFLGEQKTIKYSYIDLSLGREFPLNNRLGVNFDLGLLVQVRSHEEGDNGIIINPYWRSLPLARLQLFFSL